MEYKIRKEEAERLRKEEMKGRGIILHPRYEISGTNRSYATTGTDLRFGTASKKPTPPCG